MLGFAVLSPAYELAVISRPAPIPRVFVLL